MIEEKGCYKRRVEGDKMVTKVSQLKRKGRVRTHIIVKSLNVKEN